MMEPAGFALTALLERAMSRLHRPKGHDYEAMRWRVLEAGKGAVGGGGELPRPKRSAAARQHAADDQDARDALTGLGNRVRLAQIDEQEANPGRVFVLVDLDDFKGVNHTFGSTTGDRVLQSVAELLQAAAGPEDVVLRVGDDEFGALLCDADEHAGRELADRFLFALRRGLEIDACQIFVDASVAVAVAAEGESASSVMRRADASMYRAKRSSLDSKVSVFDPSRDGQVIDDFALRSALRGALARDEYILHYQPIIDMGTRRAVGFEALVRWQRPGLGIVPPGSFIPLAEQGGLMPELGQWVLEQACREASGWASVHGYTPYVSVNLSVRQLLDPAFAARFRGALDAAQLSPDRLIVEVTETVLARDFAAICPPLEELRRLGVRVYVDDFGTGYSSLGYLRDLPLDGVKLDRAFTRDLTTSDDAWALARAIVTMLQDLKLAVTAEGIESAAQLAQLRSLGCRHAQGFYFARPGPADVTCALAAAPSR